MKTKMIQSCDLIQVLKHAKKKQKIIRLKTKDEDTVVTGADRMNVDEKYQVKCFIRG